MTTELHRRERRVSPPARPSPSVRALGIAVPVAVVGILVAVKPEIVRGTFSSAESMARVAAVLLGWVVFSRLMRRFIPNPIARTALIAVPAAVLLWMNVAPYFKDDVKVTGRFPESAVTAGGTAPVPAQGEQQATPQPQAAPAQPVQLTTGRFRGLDGHRGSGEASVFRQPDGSHVVAFRNLSVSSVPDPVVYLVPGRDREGIEGAMRLGRFQADRDTYQIPAGSDVEGPLTVMIWCQRFSVPVAAASQSPV